MEISSSDVLDVWSLRPSVTRARVLAIGDLHFRAKTVHKYNLLRARIESLLSAEVDAVVVLGDVLHDHETLHTLALNTAYDFVSMLVTRSKAPVFVLVGNHDYIDNTQVMTDNHWMAGLRGVGATVVDRLTSFSVGDHHMLLVPYLPPGMLVETLSAREDWRDALAVFAHQEIRGCNYNGTESKTGDAWDAAFPLLVSGHIHERQLLGENVVYVGSAGQHSFAESPDKSVAVIEFSPDATTVQHVALNIPGKRTIETTLDDFSSVVIPSCQDDVRLVVRGVPGGFAAISKTDAYKKLVKRGVKVVLKPVDDAVQAPTLPGTKTVGFMECLQGLLESHPDAKWLYEQYSSR